MGGERRPYDGSKRRAPSTERRKFAFTLLQQNPGGMPLQQLALKVSDEFTVSCRTASEDVGKLRHVEGISEYFAGKPKAAWLKITGREDGLQRHAGGARQRPSEDELGPYARDVTNAVRALLRSRGGTIRTAYQVIERRINEGHGPEGVNVLERVLTRGVRDGLWEGDVTRGYVYVFDHGGASRRELRGGSGG